MHTTINSRILDKKLTFSRPGNGYIYVDINGQPGTLGRQIGERGFLTGGMISYTGTDTNEFKKICRNWLNSYIKNRR